jgi:prepilin-type N-terminal cleavage/methylation domain-containing protein
VDFADLELTKARAGFTLLELLVVLVLMGLAAALVAPALLAPRHEHDELGALLVKAREVAARRGQTISLRITAAGRWQIQGATDPREGVLATGQLQPALAFPVALIVSPIGTCALDASAEPAARVVALEALTCGIRAP